MSSAGTATRGDFRPGEAGLPRRLLLLSESAGLAAVLAGLLGPRGQLIRSSWSDDPAEHHHLAEADLVVLDVPRDARAGAFEQLRQRYRGLVVVLVDRGDKGGGLPRDGRRTLLARPFSTDDLRAALSLRTPPPTAPPRRPPAPAGPEPRAGATTAPATLAGKAPGMVAPPVGSGEVGALFPPPGTPPPPGDRGNAAQSGILSVDGRAAARVAPPRPAPPPPTPSGQRRRPAPLLDGLVHGWRTRRAVRIAAFSGLAAVAFLGAFALAAQGRCGPGCDDLTGIAPVTTLPAVDAPLAPTSAPPSRRPPSTTTATPGSGPQGVPAAVPGSSTSTTRASSGTTRPANPTTRPPTTPTTRPPTTTTTRPPTTTTTTIVVPTTTTIATP